MLVTGIRISDLLPIKINQVESLFTKYWISINRAKRDPANHKVFLTKEGNSYIFTAKNSKKPLAREAFTNLINKFIKDCVRKMDRNPKLSNHGF